MSTLSRLHHEHIVRYYNAWIEEDAERAPRKKASPSIAAASSQREPSYDIFERASGAKSSGTGWGSAGWSGGGVWSDADESDVEESDDEEEVDADEAKGPSKLEGGDEV